MKVSAILCTLNEADNLDNIIYNLQSLRGAEIIIVDGGSKDGSFEKLKNIKSSKVIKVNDKGLLSQRLAGIKLATNELIFMFNADDYLSGIDLENLIDELTDKNLDGLNISLSASKPKTFWEKGWNLYFSVCAGESKNSKVLGRPCLTYKKLFQDVKDEEGIFNEDTYLKYEQERLFGELNYEYSEQQIPRKVPNSLVANIIQFKRYGVSDASVARNNITKWYSLLYHSFIRIALLRSSKMIAQGRPQYFIFTFIFGLVRGFYLIKGK
ncbi:glycosyltransferase family 2 protein [Rhodobacteraceae bacterium]|nr:glycosyltransferase family 2 protein [Paracoccaceae bacterium]